MITLYEELAEKFNAAKADLSLLSTWNLDEYAVDERTAVAHDQAFRPLRLNAFQGMDLISNWSTLFDASVAEVVGRGIVI